jgi:hypothetical protein
MRRCAKTQRDTRRGLNAKVVFETENRRAEPQPRRQLAHRLRGRKAHSAHPDRRSSDCLAFPGLDNLCFRFLRDLLRAPCRRAVVARAACAVTGARTARHMAPLALHGRRNSSVRESQRHHPHRRQNQRQHLACPPMERPDHSLSLLPTPKPKSDRRHGAVGSMIIFS